MQAQVTIGSGEEPEKGELLQLKDLENVTTNAVNSTKGLGLPRVSLSSKTELYPMFLSTPSNPASAPSPEYNTNKAALKLSHTGMMVYNTNATSPFEEGIYTWNGARWVRLGGQDWFYMPAAVLPTLTTSPNYTGSEFVYDIYSVYAQQFGMANSASSAASETAAIPVYTADRLVYMVTYYDNTVFQNVSLTADGKLHYKVIAGVTPTDATFMNIVFKVK
jgi:hypothetical protein